MVTCPVCGEYARLDNLSRCLVTCLLAFMLWLLMVQLQLFYRGYLFVFSMLVILGGWRLLAAATLPLLSLEKAQSRSAFDRRRSVVTVMIMMLVAIAIDGLLSYRSDADKSYAARLAAEPNETAK